MLPERIRDHLLAENARADQWFSAHQGLFEELESELRGRIEPVDVSLPDKDGPWAYRTRYSEGDEYGVYLRCPRDGGEEQVILDVEREASDHEYFAEGDVEHSPDHRLLAWTVDTSGDERYTLHIRDLDTGRDTFTLEDVYEVVWGTSDTVFFTRVDEELRPSLVYRLTLGQEPQRVYEESDTRFSLSLGMFRSGAFVVIEASMTDCNEIRLIAVDDITADPSLIEPRAPGVEYSLEHQNDRFLIVTNVDDAPDFKLMEAPVASPSRAYWRELEAHREGRTLLDVDALGDWMIILARENALAQVSLVHRDGRRRQLAFDEEVYAIGIDAGLEFDASSFRLTYASPTTPDRVYEEDILSGERRLLKQRRIPSGHDPQLYRTQRMQVASYDGVEVPVTLLYHRDTPLDGSAPCLVYGYGAYGSCVPADFSADVLPLVDRGVVYAIAHVRGGQELGRRWYEAGRLEHKAASFEDLYAVLRAMVDRKFAQWGRLVIQGGSAGGLLVAATTDLVVRRDPGLVAGVIADVPFVDVLATMSDASLPLTPGEWSEWGNPIDDAAAREWIRGYSPVDRVGAHDYPALFVTAGISDPRVTWWEPARWVALLRECRTNEQPLLLRTNLESGHFGGTGRYASLADTARSLVFALAVMGLTSG